MIVNRRFPVIVLTSLFALGATQCVIALRKHSKEIYESAISALDGSAVGLSFVRLAHCLLSLVIGALLPLAGVWLAVFRHGKPNAGLDR